METNDQQEVQDVEMEQSPFQSPMAPLSANQHLCEEPILHHVQNHSVEMELEDRVKELALNDLQSRKDIKDTEFEALD